MGPAAGYAAVAAQSQGDDPGHGQQDHDDTTNGANVTASSITKLCSPSASTPSTSLTTTSPLTAPLHPFADQSSTPLSLVDDALHADTPSSVKPGLGAGSDSGPDAVAANSTDQNRQLPTATMSSTTESPPASASASTSAPARPGSSGPPAAAVAPQSPVTHVKLQKRKKKESDDDGEGEGADHLISPTITARRHATAHATASAKDHQQQHEHLTSASPRDPVQAQLHVATGPCLSDDTKPKSASASSLSPSTTEFPPLRTGSVQPDTKIAHPKPQPILRSTTDTGNVDLKHPVPDLNTRGGALAGNIAQLEATAERLSMTSSIDDAIRDLHGELKRSDSRRSSILAASVKASSVTDDASASAPSAVGQLQRHLSNASSIVATNIAARHGGYSPAAFIMSPSHSFTGRLRSGSKGSNGQPDTVVESGLSRHGPGKASVRSVRSHKMSLAEISESEPISLNQTAFEQADMAPPIDADETMRVSEHDQAAMPSTDAFHQMMDDGFAEPDHLDLGFGQGQSDGYQLIEQAHDDRPATSRSNDTFQGDPFIDFDGVHWEPSEEDLSVPPELEPEMPTPRPAAVRNTRPQSYFDPSSGQQMLYYPARVPAMLNLPPKLGNKPKAAQRTARRSQVLCAMDEVNRQAALADLTGEPAHADRSRHSKPVDRSRDSFLPDPLAGHRDSFAALSTYDQLVGNDAPAEHQAPLSHNAEPHTETATGQLRRPQRLSQMDPDNRKSRMSRMDNLPSQLRASAFFDLPSQPPEIRVKDESAMATLESILDASANAPVSAFTDHPISGKQGSEVYGKEKKRKSQAPAATLRPVSSGQQPKKRSSFMWIRRSGSNNSNEDQHGHRATKSTSALGPTHDEVAHSESDALTQSIDGGSVLHHDQNEPESEHDDYDSDDEEAYQGAPTTLLAELQMRKQQQKQRTQPLTQQFPNGMHATLLEMDAVAETQRKDRKSKRVNLAWEDPDAHLDQNGSDDDDIPLAIIAAKHQGAKNMLDLEQPIGLLELREMEENEPLSRRRARLQGLDPSPMTHHKRQSVMTLNAPSRMGARSPASRPLSRQETPEHEEIEGETLGERKRRLAAKAEAELPQARPVSSSFSAELLSQFGDLDDSKGRAHSRNPSDNPPKGEDVEEETLGQRRRRLQAEREAREREMSYGNLVGNGAPKLDRRLSMADILPAHPKKELDIRAQEERRRMEEQNRAARDQQAKLAAMRKQMPTMLTGPNVNRSGGFRSGVYNDGAGGMMGAQSSPAVYSQGMPYAQQNRASVAMNAYAPAVNSYGYAGVNQFAAPMGAYGAGMMRPGMPATTGSMDRVERWRQSVQPS